MSSNGRANLCLGSKQNAKGIISNNSVHTFAALRQVGRFAVAIFEHFAKRGFGFILIPCRIQVPPARSDRMQSPTPRLTAVAKDLVWQNN
jgi:hypothetical protein